MTADGVALQRNCDPFGLWVSGGAGILVHMFESTPGPVPEPNAAGPVVGLSAVDVAAERLHAEWVESSGCYAGVEIVPGDPWSDVDQLGLVTSLPAGPGLVSGLALIDPAGLCADDAVTFAQQVDRAAAWLAGFQARAQAVVADVVLAYERRQVEQRRFVTAEMAASAELAAALRLSPRGMGAVLGFAVDLAGPWQPLRDAMLAGDLTAGHARAVGRALQLLPAYGDPEQAEGYARDCAKVLAKVVPFARTHTPGETARRARDLVTAMDPVGTRKRRREAAERDHGVFVTPTEPGTSELTAVLPTGHAQAIYDAVRALASDKRFETADGCITAGQRRVAALVTLILGDPGQVTTVDSPVSEAKLSARVDVVVSLDTILGTSEQGGRLNGEPVPADVIRDLLTDADPASTIRRLVTDVAGCIVDAGRSRYAISDLQKRLIHLRDGRCRFVGCTRPAIDCQIDHATPYGAGGATDLQNLGPLCVFHHQLKTHHGWQITASARDGSCTWKSPLGRIYEHQPPDLLPPAPAPIDTGPPPPF